MTISHAFALAEVPEARLERLVDGLAAQRISLTTVAPGNRPPLPLARLAAAGVAVGLGCDGIRDLWSPWGDGDLLGRAALLAWRAGARRDQDLAAALELATAGGTGVLGLDGHGLEPGCWADLALVPAETVGEAVVAHPPAPWCSSGAGWSPGPDAGRSCATARRCSWVSGSPSS